MGLTKSSIRVPSSCVIIVSEENNILSNVTTTVGNQVNFQCDPGYEASTTSILCTANGFIDQINPNQEIGCNQISCSMEVNNGRSVSASYIADNVNEKLCRNYLR